MMFLISVNAKRFGAVCGAVLLLVCATIGGVYLVSKQDSVPVSANGVDLRAKDETQILSFFSQCGVSVDANSREVREVTIPDPLDDVYLTYNELQKQQGFDLTKYCGKRVKSRSYAVILAEGVPTNEIWRANVLVYRDRIIAADLAQTSVDGSMRPLIRG